MNHRIHSQCWQIKAPSQEAALAIRQQLRSQLDTALLPVFERAFDALAPGDEVLRIPRLTLEIKLYGGALNGDFITAVTQALPEVLSDKLDETLRDAALARSIPIQPRQIGPGKIQSGEAGAQHLSAPAHQRRTLLHYLSTGLLEWHEHCAWDDGTRLQVLREEAAALAGDTSALQAALDDFSCGSLTKRLAASFRLLQLLPAGSRPALLASAARYAGLPDNPVEAVQPANLLPGLLRQLASQFVVSPGGHLLLRVQAMLLALREADLRRPFDPQIAAWLRDCQHQAATRTDSNSVEMQSAIAALFESAPAITLPPQPANTQPPLPSPRAEDIAAIGYLTSDAGLILLHPFLPRLFTELNITPGGILPEAMLPRAAALLHWLVNAREEVYEYELTLIKVLLGLTPSHPLPVSAGLLDKADRAEADALLAAALSHWEVLGKTSVSTLRGTFLQRRGLLRDTDSGWQLQVETAPFDLLLGRLPWSISLVRLPWMSRPMFTEWITP